VTERWDGSWLVWRSIDGEPGHGLMAYISCWSPRDNTIGMSLLRMRWSLLQLGSRISAAIWLAGMEQMSAIFHAVTAHVAHAVTYSSSRVC
jgi:hypothetical protein